MPSRSSLSWGYAHFPSAFHTFPTRTLILKRIVFHRVSRLLATLASDRMPFGSLLETFVLAELLELASWHDERLEFFHFRDRYNNEVDIVIEDPRGHIVGIEIKASATVTTGDFSGLRKLAEACGKRFILGLVLYDHMPPDATMAMTPVATQNPPPVATSKSPT